MVSRPLSLAALVSLLLAGHAWAAPAFYPVNGCVSAKQKDAAGYCGSVLEAWSKYETTQDASKRDATIERMLRSLCSRALRGSGLSESTATASACRPGAICDRSAAF